MDGINLSVGAKARAVRALEQSVISASELTYADMVGIVAHALTHPSPEAVVTSHYLREWNNEDRDTPKFTINPEQSAGYDDIAQLVLDAADEYRERHQTEPDPDDLDVIPEPESEPEIQQGDHVQWWVGARQHKGTVVGVSTAGDCLVRIGAHGDPASANYVVPLHKLTRIDPPTAPPAPTVGVDFGWQAAPYVPGSHVWGVPIAAPPVLTGAELDAALTDAIDTLRGMREDLLRLAEREGRTIRRMDAVVLENRAKQCRTLLSRLADLQGKKCEKAGCEVAAIGGGELCPMHTADAMFGDIHPE